MSFEIQITLENLAINIAGIHWPAEKNSKQSKIPILGLHGWLDNANTFEPVSKYLSSHDFFSIDLPGHGNSDHLPLAATYSVVEYVNHIHEFANQMGWDKFHILGHSLGACVGSVFAGIFSEKIESLALIEGLGPLSRPEEETPEAFKKYILKRSGKKSRMPTYAQEKDAVIARAKGSDITEKSAEVLVARGLCKKGDRYTWKSDSRLMQPSPQRLTEGQVHSFLEKISCPTLLINADDGMSYHRETYKDRISKVQNMNLVELKGQHHLHLDHPAPVGEALADFYR